MPRNHCKKTKYDRSYISYTCLADHDRGGAVVYTALNCHARKPQVESVEIAASVSGQPLVRSEPRITQELLGGPVGRVSRVDSR